MSDLIVTLESIRRRDPSAIAELVKQHHRQLRGYVAAISADLSSVDDISQEVFLRALERLDHVSDLEDFPRFLRGIARNVVREHFRKSSLYSERYVAFVEEAYAGAAGRDADTPFKDPQLIRALRNCVGKLPANSQKMLNLRYTGDLRSDEIGKKMNLNSGAVRIALLRIREALMKCVRSSLGADADAMEALR
ncbi:MAG TPA: sigma-70 family RNA polymerase sigma factor [Planctomycetota bacterium]|nr:sigma-70 family RNA polymerase sigma factor [Planctomycetota bacterium]